MIGLMSGTSADGIDAVVARIFGSGRSLRAKLLVHSRVGFSVNFRRRILHAGLRGTVSEICELNFLLGEHFARAALAVIQKAKLKPSQITAIGSHGQTVHHLPKGRPPSTLQIGEPCVIAELTGITTVADFRVRDMAAGGQGAPLVAYADWVLFTHDTHPRIIQNLGGIGNLTFLRPQAQLEEVMAFDTGPGNTVIDAVVSALSAGRLTYDRNGRWAASGHTSPKLLIECMKHPYLRREVPKTTGREEFGEEFLNWLLTRARRLRLSEADTVATATEFTAASIVHAYRHFVLPQLKARRLPELQIIVGGGGVKNPTLVRFAILAHETLRGQPSNVPFATGAKRAVVLGKVIPGHGNKA